MQNSGSGLTLDQIMGVGTLKNQPSSNRISEQGASGMRELTTRIHQDSRLVAPLIVTGSGMKAETEQDSEMPSAHYSTVLSPGASDFHDERILQENFQLLEQRLTDNVTQQD